MADKSVDKSAAKPTTQPPNHLTTFRKGLTPKKGICKNRVLSLDCAREMKYHIGDSIFQKQKGAMMNSFKKIVAVGAFAALSASALANAELKAVENETPRGGEPFESYGWTAIAIGVATPVQIPWGIKKWDVFGLDLNLGYSDAPKMYGWEFALGANTARKTFMGLQTAIGFNYSNKDAYGLAFSLVNINNDKFYGASVDAVGYNRNVYGLELNVLGSAIDEEMGGLEVSLLGNFINGSLYGAQLAVGANLTRNMNGFQFAIYNQTAMLWGLQLGLVNYASACDHGLQICLVNIIMDNQVPVLPIVNWYF